MHNSQDWEIPGENLLLQISVWFSRHHPACFCHYQPSKSLSHVDAVAYWPILSGRKRKPTRQPAPSNIIPMQYVHNATPQRTRIHAVMHESHHAVQYNHLRTRRFWPNARYAIVQSLVQSREVCRCFQCSSGWIHTTNL
jgi:hypothetical protein